MATHGSGAVAAPSAVTDAHIPGALTLRHAARLAMDQDKPIMLDYYLDTREGRAFIGEDAATKEKILVRSEDEYTSIIQNMFKTAENDFIVVTENSVYLVSANVRKRFIRETADGGVAAVPAAAGAGAAAASSALARR
jgi:hypothetical protein